MSTSPTSTAAAKVSPPPAPLAASPPLPATPPHAESSVEAVAMDPNTLWAALGLPAPESLPSQHTARRVILLGKPRSGKRTLCRRLCYAAEAQYAAANAAESEDTDDRLHGGTPASFDTGRQPLYNPPSSDEEDTALYPNANQGAWNLPGAFSAMGGAAGRLAERSALGPHTHQPPLSHGSGVSFDYVVQRVPTRLAGGEGGSAKRTEFTREEGGASFPAPSSSFLPGSARRGVSNSSVMTAAGFPSGGSGTVRRTTEFFCCDSPGALSMALPTIEDVENAVALVVVDVSDVSSIRSQLDFGYGALNTYVANLLRAQAPHNDEVRRMQLASAQQDFWYAEEQKLKTTRAHLASSVSTGKEGRSEVLFKDPAASLEKVNSTAFRVPSSAGTVCTLHSVIVCTKAENLERVSRFVGTLDAGSDAEFRLLDRLGVSADLFAAVRRSRLSLLSLVSQMIRHYAVYRRAGFASLCQRVNMTTAGADGEYANSTLVNPFYKGFWAYLSYVLYRSKDGNAGVPSDVLRVCSARMHPHSLLPCGLDAPGLLSYFVTSSDSVQLPEGSHATAGSSQQDIALDTAIRTTQESVSTPDGVFALHQRYVQPFRSEDGAGGPLPSEQKGSGEDAGMVWDSL